MFFLKKSYIYIKRAYIRARLIIKVQTKKTMTNEERKKKQDKINEIPVLYCTKCMSLKIKRKEGKEYILYCDNCGAGAFDLDSTGIFRWIELCQEKGKSNLIAKKTSVYDDIDDVYKEQAVEKITEAECIENGVAGGVKITDYLYRNLHNLEKRSNPTQNFKNQLTDKAVEQLSENVLTQISDNSDNNALISTDNE